MEKIYIIEEGEYSDRRITAVFSEEEDAAAYVKKIDDGYYESWNIDEYIKFARGNFKYYRVKMFEDGDIGSIDICSPEVVFTEAVISEYSSKRLCFWTKVLARDSEHAIKIAGDRRRILIVNGKFLEERERLRLKELNEMSKEAAERKRIKETEIFGKIVKSVRGETHVDWVKKVQDEDKDILDWI